MRSFGIGLTAVLIGAWMIAAWPKDGFVATVHTSIPAEAAEGTQLAIEWTLSNPENDWRFNANSVFVRLIGPTGDATEGFAPEGAHVDGHYRALVTIPRGGVSGVEIGVAGRARFPDGRSERSDWLMPLANDPLVPRGQWRVMR